MEQRSTWEANTAEATEEIPRILWNLRVWKVAANISKE
jgi:hypothetical protein